MEKVKEYFDFKLYYNGPNGKEYVDMEKLEREAFVDRNLMKWFREHPPIKPERMSFPCWYGKIVE